MRRCRSGWSFRSSLWRFTLSHFTLLRLPYYWDEAGYYIPAAWDFFRTGSLIPTSTLTNAHPPLPSIYLALCWKASGFHPEGPTREAVLLVATLGLLAVWRLTMRLVGVASVAFWTVLLTGLYPIWFAQSSLAHADIFAAACSLWGLVYALPNRSRTLWPCRVVVRGRRAFKRDGDRDPADPGRGKLAAGFRSGGPVRWLVLARGRVALKLCSAPGCVVRIPLREDRVFVRQSRVFPLQRGSDADSAAHSGGVRASPPAPDGAHESLCAGDDGPGGIAAQSARRCRGTRPGDARFPGAAADFIVFCWPTPQLFSVLKFAHCSRVICCPCIRWCCCWPCTRSAPLCAPTGMG